MNFRRLARLYLPPTFVLTVLAVPRTPLLGSGVQVLAAWSHPPNDTESEPSGAGADPDAGPDAGGDADVDGGTGNPTALCGGADDHLATTSTLGAGCC